MSDELETVRDLICIVHGNLDELYEAKAAGELDDFALDQIYAYVECLETLQKCPAFRALGLDYEIEERFPVM